MSLSLVKSFRYVGQARASFLANAISRECFLEAYNVTECPNCSKDISSLSSGGQQQVLCTVRNEGGVQEAFDILPPATEEAFLRTYPEERIAHAFLEFCRKGDIDAIVHLAKDAELNDAEQDNDDDEKIDILRYQGTFEGIEGSGLHVAIRYNQEEVAWLMLALGSSLDWAQFPARVLQGMKELNLWKEDRKAGIDVRSLQDGKGRTAASLAQDLGGVWSDWCKSGRLLPG